MIGFPSLAALAAPKRLDEAPRCELCAAPIAAAHRHVVELGRRGVLCACHACAILFTRVEPSARFRTVADRVLADRSCALSAEQWASAGIPVALAFCYRASTTGRVLVCYPSPAGIVDGELDDAAWRTISATTALASQLEPDIEALLVRGTRGASRMTCYLVPISSAYELAARLRGSWRGFSGGDEADRELAAFFAELDARGGRA
jgi:hypothetical protein